MSSKLPTVSVIRQHDWLRVDIRGDSNARPATISAHEDQNYAWAFNGIFVVSLHPDLFNDPLELFQPKNKKHNPGRLES